MKLRGLLRSDDIGIRTLRVQTLSNSFKSSSTWKKREREREDFHKYSNGRQKLKAELFAKCIKIRNHE